MAKLPLTSVTYPVPEKMVLAAQFDQGQAPLIAVVNVAEYPLGYDLKAMVAALQIALDRDFASVWTACKDTKLKIFPDVKSVPKDAWTILLTDTVDVAGALGYHDLSKRGLPIAPCFVKTTRENGGDIAVTVSHELWEMLVDPGIQMWAQGPQGVFYAYETADAVEETDYVINGVRISNFQYPSWFESFRKRNSVRFDFLGLCTKPFQLLKGGYSIVYGGGNEQQIFGSAAKAKRFAAEPRALHRSEFRKLPQAERLSYGLRTTR